MIAPFHAVQRINSSHPSQAALVRLEWELTSSRISHFLPVFIRNLGHDSSDPSHPDKYTHAKVTVLLPVCCVDLCTSQLQHPGCQWLQHLGKGCVLAVCCSHQLCHSCYTGLSRETLVRFTLSCYLRRDILVAGVSKQSPPPSILTFTYESKSS